VWFDKSPDNINTDISDLLLATAINLVEMIGAKIYPNPTSSELNFEFGDNKSDRSIIIRDALGRQVEVFNHINESNFKLNTELYSKGLYFYELSQNGQTATGKFVVN